MCTYPVAIVMVGIRESVGRSFLSSSRKRFMVAIYRLYISRIMLTPLNCTFNSRRFIVKIIKELLFQKFYIK